MKTMKAENESSLAKNEAAIDRLRATIEGQSKDIVKFISTMAAVIIGILGGLIALVQFFG